MSRDQRRWTAAEDDLLREGYRWQAAGPSGKGRTINWSEIAKRIPGRSNKDCRKRYFNEVSGCLKKGPWTEEEDSRLKSYVQQFGLLWTVIAQTMENRSADQCSKRWHHCLDPALDRRQWTDEDNKCLLLALATHGNSWKDIQMIHFPARSANNVKNQYTVLAHKNISVPPDASPCCPQRSHPAPVSPSSGTSSKVSTPLLTEGSSLVTSDHNFFSLESTNSSCHGLPDGSTEDLPLPSDTTSPFDFDLNDADAWNSSGHGLCSMVSPSELVDMSDLEGHGFEASLSASGLGAGNQGYDTTSASLDVEIEGWDMDLDGNSPSTSIAPIKSGKLQPHASKNPANPVPAHHSRGDGMIIERASSNSRITITIDHAEPETVMGVMQVLVQSRAKVELYRG